MLSTYRIERCETTPPAGRARLESNPAPQLRADDAGGGVLSNSILNHDLYQPFAKNSVPQGVGSETLTEKEGAEMESFLTVVMPIAAVGALYVVLPVVTHTYSRFRGGRTVTCPDTQAPAEVAIDAGRAAASSAVGKLQLRVQRCSRWPEHQQCGQECLSAVR